MYLCTVKSHAEDGLALCEGRSYPTPLESLYFLSHPRSQYPCAVMRLLEVKDHGEFGLTRDLSSKIPPYAIFSHTWGADTDEVALRDLMDGTG